MKDWHTWTSKNYSDFFCRLSTWNTFFSLLHLAFFSYLKYLVVNQLHVCFWGFFLYKEQIKINQNKDVDADVDKMLDLFKLNKSYQLFVSFKTH